MPGWVQKASSGKTDLYVRCATRENGDVHIIGGQYVSDTSARTHKKYDPLLDTWTTYASLPASINPISVNFIAITGLLWANGGGSSGLYPTATETWNPGTNTWTARAACPENRYNSIVTQDGTYVYVLGGWSTASATPGSGVLRYTIATHTWTTTLGSGAAPGTAHYGYGGGILYSGKIFYSTHYFTIAGATYTQYTTTATSQSGWEVRMVGGLPYGTLGTYVITNFEDANNSGGMIDGHRDLAVAPYTYVTTWYGYGVPFSWNPSRAIATGAATYLTKQFYSSGPSIYAHGGEHWFSGNLVDRWDKYDQDYSIAITATTPADGGTVNKDFPQYIMTVPDNGDKVRPLWQVASDSAFTTNVKNIVYPFPVQSGSISKESAGPSEELTQGTWYLRARGESGLEYTPWSTTRTFTVSHPPAASLTFPVNGQGYIFGTGDVTFQWNFSDTETSDNQTAYQLVLERNDTGAVLLDTGKVTSSVKQHGPYNISVTYKNLILRWKVKLWDSDNVAGAYSAYSTFSLSDAPVVNITAPAQGGTADSGNPAVVWTFTAAGRTQYSYRVRFYNSVGSLAYDSGVIVGTALTHTPPNAVIGVGNASVTVDVVDSMMLTATDTNTFTAVFDEPAQPQFFVDDSVYDSTGYVQVTWTSANRDATFTEYRVYRREVGDTTWTLLYTDNDNSASNYTFNDYSAGSGKSYEYSVVQLAQRAQTPVESQKTTITQADPVSTQYWLIDNDNPDRNILIPNVTDDSFTDEYEQATLKVIGRGNHVDYGTRWGYVGSLSAQLRGTNARLQRLQLEYLKSLRVEMYLRNPFGDVWRVATGNIQVDRLSGVGTTEMSDITIPYEEVS